MADAVTGVDRPDAMEYAAELEAADAWSRDDVQLVVYCDRCSTRIGVVFATEHGPLWVGFLGPNRTGRQIRRGMLAQAGVQTDGRTIVAIWVEEWRPYYICTCKCRRNAADALTIHATLRARKRRVRVSAQHA